VTPRFGGFPDPALLRSNLARVLDGSLALDEALARKERDYAPAAASGEPAAPARVLWFDDEATGAVVMELRGTDRIGLLHRVAAALARCDIGLRWARVSTLGASVVDAFCLDTDDGTVGLPQRRLVERAVLTAAR
jgi:[protein-PII] uridylyltransferase